MIVIIFSLSRLLRILHQKHRMRQHISWRKHRKMTIQLLSIALPYLITRIPPTILGFIRGFEVSEEFGAELTPYAAFFISYDSSTSIRICNFLTETR